MKIAYFKDRETGEIVNYQNLEKTNMSSEQIQKIAKDNNEKRGKYIVFLADVKESSLIAHLIKKNEERIKYRKEEIEDIIDNLEDALYSLRGLEVWVG